VIVTIDSTFGYEMFSRGSKVVFVSNRLARIPGINRESFNFGYPVIRDATGPFWTNSIDPEQISRLVSSVINMNADTWARCSKPIRLQLMPFDEGNSILNGTLEFLDDSHSETVPQ
jgi:surface carbohydrate biosynthesis protein